MKRRDNKSGFSTIEGLLILVIVTIIGFVGWYVWHSNKEADTLTATTSASSTKQQAKPNHSEATQETKNSLGLTQSDKNAIVATILQDCQTNSPGTSFTVVTEPNLDKADQTVVKGNFVVSNQYCYFDGLSESEQYSGSNYLLQKTKSGWVVLGKYQMAPACTSLDNKGIPSGLIECTDENNQPRSPVT